MEIIAVKPRIPPRGGGPVVAVLKSCAMCIHIRLVPPLPLRLSQPRRNNGGNYSIPNDMPLLASCSRILVTAENSSLDWADSYLQENYASRHISFPTEQHLSLLLAEKMADIPPGLAYAIQ